MMITQVSMFEELKRASGRNELIFAATKSKNIRESEPKARSRNIRSSSRRLNVLSICYRYWLKSSQHPVITKTFLRIEMMVARAEFNYNFRPVTTPHAYHMSYHVKCRINYCRHDRVYEWRALLSHFLKWFVRRSYRVPVSRRMRCKRRICGYTWRRSFPQNVVKFGESTWSHTANTRFVRENALFTLNMSMQRPWTDVQLRKVMADAESVNFLPKNKQIADAIELYNKWIIHWIDVPTHTHRSSSANSTIVKRKHKRRLASQNTYFDQTN